MPSGACNLFQMSCHFSMKTLLERYKISNEYQDLKKKIQLLALEGMIEQSLKMINRLSVSQQR